MLTVQPFDTEDEAVALANGTPYGLAAGLQTRDVARAHRVAARLDAGIVWVNDWAMLDPAVPFGGVKDSGFGREYGPEALEAYTRVKSVVVSLLSRRSSHDHHHPSRRRRVRRRPLHPGRRGARRAPRRRGPGPDDRRRPVPHRPRRRLGRTALPAARRARATRAPASSSGSAPPSPRWRPGDHVLLSFTSCGGCGNCRGGHPAYCATWLPDNLIGGARRDGSATITRDGRAARRPLLRPVVVRPHGRRRRAQRRQGRPGRAAGDHRAARLRRADRRRRGLERAQAGARQHRRRRRSRARSASPR